jgi:membrane-associated phospholipid phosphatase
VRNLLASTRQRRWILTLVVSVATLCVDGVFVETGWFQSVDRTAWSDFATRVGPHAFRVIEAFSLVGVVKEPSRDLSICAVLMTVALAGVMTLRQYPFAGATLVVAVSGAAATSRLLKQEIVRSGASLSAWTPGGHTFPSGTAATSVAFFAMLAYFGYHRLRRSRPAILAICALGAMVFALSALTYHYPSEVIGGIALGIAWVAVLQIVFWDPLRKELFYREVIEPTGSPHNS